MRKLSKMTTIAAGTVGAVAVSGIAFAYWTSTGSGTGSAGSGTTSPVTVNQTSTITTLAPGVAPVTLSGTFDNPNAATVRVGTVSVSVASVTKATGAPAGTCDSSDYVVTDATPTNAEIASGNGVGSWTGATIGFNNKAAVSQDACKGATVNLAYSVS
jgi:hypothetical protein